MDKPRYLDYDGLSRAESSATGPIIRNWSDTVRVRRQAHEGLLRHDVVIEWWDGSRWLSMYHTNMVANSYADTEIHASARLVTFNAAKHEARSEQSSN